MGQNELARITRNELSFPQALSFSQILITEWQSIRINAALPGRKLDSKRIGYNFADQIGLRRPQTDVSSHPLDELKLDTPRVVKPARATGGRGVMLAYSEDRIVSLRDRKVFKDWSSSKAHAHKVMNDHRKPIRDSWFTEELILEDDATAARDLKFYAFYGRVCLVLEYVRYPERKACFWDKNGEAVDTGVSYPVLNGLGVSKQDIDLVESVSREIPRPYMRIDMLKGRNELVLGEFTPRPGGFQDFNKHWDRLLGEEWVRAESRLISDLLKGKSFRNFQDAK